MNKLYKQIFFLTIVLQFFHYLPAGDNETCLECHGDAELTTERGGKEISLFIDQVTYSKSVHKDIECISCHKDADVEELPHDEDLQDVFCGNCHDRVQMNFDNSIHGNALRQKKPYAPNCISCHGKHDILSSNISDSPTYKMNIPYLCGKCHREGAPVANVYRIAEHNIIENYSQSIHGEGLFKKGLIVTATCTDCHNSHLILPHNNRKASIASNNIAGTCMKCHSKIEDVHTKIIRGQLWKSKPGVIPSCTSCHLPHKVKKESIELTLSDRSCQKCHGDREIKQKRVSLFVSKEELNNSVHENIPCVKCHTDINPQLHRPCETAGQIDCSNCHAKTSEEYYLSGHGKNYLKGDRQVPYCVNCHGSHNVLSHKDERSPVFRSSIPMLCGKCHREDTPKDETKQLSEVAALTDYSTSVHGRGLIQKGLLPSAICTDCHNTHLILNQKDEMSSVHHNNVPATCSTCHRGIFKQFIKSIHFSTGNEEKEKLPTCTDCHSSHTISPVMQDKFKNEVTYQCGSCHTELAKTYYETMHGKAYTLGYLESAKCSDCHGSHDILDVNDPDSKVGFKNVVSTCQKCHQDANRRFTGYLTHATHHDPVKYPLLFYTYWFMTILLIGVFSFFGVHTLLWLPRSIRNLLEHKKVKKQHKQKYYIKRFNLSQRITHAFVIISFILLALTGMMLKFSAMPWAEFLSKFFGGVPGAGLIHRIAAVITFGYFFFHLFNLYKEKKRQRISWFQFVFNSQSLMFNKQDVKDFIATMKWFLGFGKKPEYGRWTYWEKFDYFAVFWGVTIIGLSGLIQWFPEYFTLILPGWMINVAAIIHSDEALLAVGFIFTIHFFNTHLRPEVFPMDKVIFTGTMELEEYKNERPRDYQNLMKSGQLKKVATKQTLSENAEKIYTLLGFIALSTGLVLIGLIIYSMLFGYK